MNRIEPICRHLCHLETVARWHWDEWGHADPSGSLATWTEALATRTNVDSIPTTFIALDESDGPIGSITLVHSDMSTHTDLGPWIAGLYVVPAHRRHGFGSALMKHATDAALRMGHGNLYLHTSTSESLYTRLGWSKLFAEHYEGENVCVMRYDA